VISRETEFVRFTIAGSAAFDARWHGRIVSSGQVAIHQRLFARVETSVTFDALLKSVVAKLGVVAKAKVHVSSRVSSGNFETRRVLAFGALCAVFVIGTIIGPYRRD
jgi:hypothetical protein